MAAVAVPPKQQVAELMENLKISDQPKSMDATKAPAKDEKKNEVKSTAVPPNDSIGAKENKQLGDTLEHGPYYPTNNYYGYYYPGHEAPGKEWDEASRFPGMDGLELQYPGVPSENGSVVYYTPGYGYPPQTAYNPYNPYIPGAMMGGDGQFIGQRPYYNGPPYQHTGSSGYFPHSVHPSSQDPGTLGAGQTNANGNVGSNAAYKTNEQDGLKNVPHSGGVRSQGFRAMSQIQLNQQQGLGVRGTVPPKDSLPFRKYVPGTFNQGKLFMQYPNSNMAFKPNGRGRGKPYGKSNENWNFDVLNEQNRGPRTSRTKSPQMPSEASKNSGSHGAVGNGEAHSNLINREQYNCADFPVEHVSAKFFVIKSYSEDDVHQSIKYNVWASTPNGNKRLDGAYQEAQSLDDEKSGSCPVFLFFSVNASGQFCGLAEMTGNVDFNKNMDFWQQDKWNGFFPVKWHIIKDIPNSQFRQIILENNENKPVTNSRDTQEIKFSQGIEMLKIFKNYASKTSILDDFTYYEARQKAMKEKKLKQQVHQPQPLAVRIGTLAQKSGADGIMSKSSDVKATELRLPVPSANGNNLSDSNDLKKAVSGQFDEKKEAVKSLSGEPKKNDSEEMCIKGSGVLIVGSVPC